MGVYIINIFTIVMVLTMVILNKSEKMMCSVFLIFLTSSIILAGLISLIGG